MHRDPLERWPGSLLFERCRPLPQSQVLSHEVGSLSTHRPDHPGAERDEEYENTEHRSQFGVPARCSQVEQKAGRSLISHADG